ncbi:ATP-binding cassette domain-containing protein [Thermosipho ferrireducens]|uniref:ATP-binding cassette domain-containing protein n=1 Tax=Thermosipho ferrireducens TaxID=2571116 RepID=A0ABX7SAM2_9BACT|nr:ATP-binding cassette domain-containing protein [Thermosipho ferrireducens]
MKIPKNKIISIMGKSGRGKSTLLNIILKLYKPSKGEIYIFW